MRWWPRLVTYAVMSCAAASLSKTMLGASKSRCASATITEPRSRASATASASSGALGSLLRPLPAKTMPAAW